MTGFLLALALVLLVTAVHELGHLLAAWVKGARVVRFAIGMGPVVAGFRWGETDYVLCALPLGGSLAYRRLGPGTANAVIALGGATANVVFAFVLLWVAAIVLGVERMPFGLAELGAAGYAMGTVGAWIAALPAGLAAILTGGDGGPLRALVDTWMRLLDAPGPATVAYGAASLSVTWAVLNMVPIPYLGTDGWRLIVSLRDALAAALRPSTADAGNDDRVEEDAR